MGEKEFLQQYRIAGCQIIRINCEIEELRTQAELPSNRGLSGIVVQTSAKNRMEIAVAKLVDAERELSDELQKAHDTRALVKKSISAIQDEKLREVLTYLYICGFTAEQTADIINCEARTVYRRRNIALKKIKIPTECH